MRTLWLHVPMASLRSVDRVLDEQQASNVVYIPTTDSRFQLIMAHVTNRAVGDVVQVVDEIPDARVTLSPHNVVPMAPPADSIAGHIADVAPRSPLEVWLNGWQSIGQLRGFIIYAMAASIIVWIGLYSNTSYLLVAAMLIAPFAGPAMLTAMGTAGGDLDMVRKSVGRYALAIGITVLTTAALSVIFGHQYATATMVDVGEISAYAVLLPLVAGAAGALDLVKTENSSLVSGAAVGMLVTASLAPPAGLIGMAVAIGRYQLALDALFLLALQLVGINLSGAITFRVAGLKSEGIRYERGRPRIFQVSAVVSLVALVALVAFQWNTSLMLQRSTVEQRVSGTVGEHFADDPLVNLISSETSFANQQEPARYMLVEVTVSAQGEMAPIFIERYVTTETETLIRNEFDSVTPLVAVTIVEPPEAQAPAVPGSDTFFLSLLHFAGRQGTPGV